MRVTQHMMANSFSNNMNRNLYGLSKLQNQLSTGKNFTRPSDDPYGVAKSMTLNSELSTLEQYGKNIDEARSFMDVTDTAMQQISDSLNRMTELMVSLGNGGYGEDEYDAVAAEIDQIIAEIGQAMNTTFNGEYIFGGLDGINKPVSVETVEYTYIDEDGNEQTAEYNRIYVELDLDALKEADNTSRWVEVARGVEIEYGIDISDIISAEYLAQDDEGRYYIAPLDDLQTKLLSAIHDEDPDAVDDILDGLDDFKDFTTSVANTTAKVGAVYNRLQSASSQNEDITFNTTHILSNIEDIDFAEKMMEYAMAQTIYTSSLQTGSMILQPTLLDYI